jgi:2-oxoisovalerate dehydrogenase E1 component alpha subunit
MAPAGAETLLEIYYMMHLARTLDERLWVLQRQGKIAFHISGMGQEGLQVAAAFALDRERDFLHPYYRDLALCLAWGMTPREMMLSNFAKEGEPNSGARQMPAHYGHRALRIISSSSPVSTQIPQAVGVALANKMRGEEAVTLVCFGEGGSSKGDFHEGLNFAGIHQVPVIFLCQNNQYTLSMGLRAP